MKRQELYNPKRDRGSGNIGAVNVGEYKERLKLIGLVFVLPENAVSDAHFADKLTGILAQDSKSRFRQLNI